MNVFIKWSTLMEFQIVYLRNVWRYQRGLEVVNEKTDNRIANRKKTMFYKVLDRQLNIDQH